MMSGVTQKKYQVSTNKISHPESHVNPISAQLNEWKTNGTGKIAHKFVVVLVSYLWFTDHLHCSGCEAMMKFCPSTTELASIGPTFQPRWETFFKHNPDKPIAIVGVIPGWVLV